MFNLNEQTSLPMRLLKSFVDKQKKNVEREKFDTIEFFFHCKQVKITLNIVRKRLKTCRLFNDSLFSSDKTQMNLSPQRFCQTRKEDKD